MWGWEAGQLGGWADTSRLTRHARFSTCTIGYAISAAGAAVALGELDLATYSHVDLQLRYFEQAGAVTAVVFDPPLVGWAGGRSDIDLLDSGKALPKEGQALA